MIWRYAVIIVAGYLLGNISMGLIVSERYHMDIREHGSGNAGATNVLRVAGNHAADHPCFLCAKMRRGHLYAEAQKRGCNKIALGHHYDDAIETVLMGIIYGGQVQAMLPRVKAKNYAGMELIRPLYLTREKAVQAWADFCGLTFLPCDCPAKTLESDTKRAEIKALIASLAAGNPQIEANILNAVKNVDTAKLVGWRDENGKHSFLDRL